MSPDVIKKALFQLKKDKFLAKIIKKSPKPVFKKSTDYFQSLVRSIIYQQLSGQAAGTILRRFKSLFRSGLTPQKVLKLKDKDFKSVGISSQKMNYLRDLSLKFLDGTINPKLFKEMTDEAIRTHLISVKGIGRWTADMFLMFTLCRTDVLPTGDLGIQKGFARLFNLKKLPNTERMEKIAENWRPYRTIASWFLWRVVDGDTEDSDW